MGNPDHKISDFVDIVKSWIPGRSESANVSRDFWMPDHSCRVCYECDSQFTVFNRRHHCRLCGRVFCAKCTASSIPAPSDFPRTGGEDWERIRVCNYCFRQWQQGIAAPDDETNVASPVLSSSPSATSLVSTRSSCTCNSCGSTVGSTPYSSGPYQRMPYRSGHSPQQSSQMDPSAVEQDNATCERFADATASEVYSSADQFGYRVDRSNDEDDEYSLYDHSVAGTRDFSNAGYYGPSTFHEIDHMYGPHEMIHDRDQIDATGTYSSPTLENFDSQGADKIKNDGEEACRYDGDECELPSYNVNGADAEPVDFENNGLLWLPSEPEDEDDEREADLNDDDDYDEAATGDWGYVRPSNGFGSGEYRYKDKSSGEHRNAIKNVVEGHFRALVAQLLQVENISLGNEDDKESWLDIVTSLSWEAATLLKPDTSKGGGMDPGGYVKVKCIACGHRSESMVVKGVVCKKNVAHRRMRSKIDKPRFLILGGALEYQRVSNHLSSVDTLLQQEMDHLKMAVAKIGAHHPNVLLVEKSVSRYAQEYLLAKDISLVLNIKKPLLDRIARCTDAHVVPSVDHLNSLKLGHCDLFHVEKFVEEHGSAGQGGKKLTKTLMFFEGCPKPLGYTILLKGSHGDELKKVKHVVQYGVFAAYHLALETSFLADEGALLPELPLTSPITVALPNKPSSIDRSISTIPGFSVPVTVKPSGFQPTTGVQKSNTGIISESALPINVEAVCKSVGADDSTRLSINPAKADTINIVSSSTENLFRSSSLFHLGNDSYNNVLFNHDTMKAANSTQSKQTNIGKADYDDPWFHTPPGTSGAMEESLSSSYPEGKYLVPKQDGNNLEEIGSSKEEFPPSPSDHQSILVSLSTRCVWKGTVCERAHLFRIKYYGSFDKPLGRFLRDHLFDQNYCCCCCEMPSEAHVYCYTHRQGSLTISVKKLPEFLLPGERKGKIWMWHRCLRCPRINGFPPATRRVVMSDAAWGLSFGKFLELSFSNHAAASRVASCGHSLQRDCLRFYGFGRMVACFRYTPIHVHSVYLPPSKIEFKYDNQEWIQKELNEAQQRAELLFEEVQTALHRMSEKTIGAGSQNGNLKASELSRLRIAELEGMLQKEKEQFAESFQNLLSKDKKAGQPAVDILDINKLRRQVLFHSYVWDQLLIDACSSTIINPQESPKGSVSKLKEKRVNSVESLVEADLSPKPGKSLSSCDSVLVGTKPEPELSRERNDSKNSQPVRVHEIENLDLDPNAGEEAESCLSSGEKISEKSDPHGSGKVVRRAYSEGEFPIMNNLSDTLDAAWIGKNQVANVVHKENFLSPQASISNTVPVNPGLENGITDKGGNEGVRPIVSASTAKGPQNVEKSRPVGVSFPDISSSFKRISLWNAQKLNISENNPVYVSLFRELERQSGARLLLPISINDTIIPVYDDEPTSIVAYALYSSDYRQQMSELEKPKDVGDPTTSLPIFDSTSILLFNSFDELPSDNYRSVGSIEESILSVPGSRGSQGSDPLSYTKDLHTRVSFTDESTQGKVKYVVTCYYANRFEALRKICCPSELDFIRSLSRCKKWGAQGGKSNVFFAKTLDDRFIIKQVTKTELESFIKFGPAYFKYLSDSISKGSPTCLAKILGIYQVLAKHLKGGKESKMDILVMENLLFGRDVVRLYDLKGSSRSRYNADTSGNNKVLLDQNLIEAMPTSPIFIGNKAKRLLERAVWNDTGFLAPNDVMDYSLLVGVDEKKNQLVVGIIDFMRQYTWDKHLETWVKAAGILGGPRNATPTVISPQQYKKRFRKAMTAYFLVVPDQWSSTTIPSGSQSDICEENLASAD